jgi:ankyrin repeat protein
MDAAYAALRDQDGVLADRLKILKDALSGLHSALKELVGEESAEDAMSEKLTTVVPMCQQRNVLSQAVTAHSSLLNAVLKYPVDVNATSHPERLTPLHFAAAMNSCESIRLLLAAGADVDRLANKDTAPLQYGLSHSVFGAKATKVLLEAGANPWHRVSSSTLYCIVIVQSIY